ncbi:MAG TPA: FUSC family protein [Sphingobium sp.]|uniref:FUSC family protein n=1 Tax=Sphingobium sp. TaxID=1912891 RepID=UPI002ED47B3D
MQPVAQNFSRITARTVDEVECVLSVLLAIWIAHRLNATHVSWAAYAGYMVMRGHVGETLSRGSLRIVGTIGGGLIALGITPYLVGSTPLAAIALLLVGAGSLYAALTARRAYAWLFYGLTFAMVVLDKLEKPNIALQSFVETRILENIAGTAACMAVSLLSTLSLRRLWPAPPSPRTPIVRWHPDAFRHAIQAGLALAVLVLLGTRFHFPALAQSAITIMAVLLVPASGLSATSATPVRQRLRHRFLGCMAGAALAGLVLLVAQGSAFLLILGTVAGIVIGRHIENGTSPYRYAGMQFTLAMLVILVPDNYTGVSTEPGYERLIGILIGMALLEPILIFSHWLVPKNIDAPTSVDASEKVGEL